MPPRYFRVRRFVPRSVVHFQTDPVAVLPVTHNQVGSALRLESNQAFSARATADRGGEFRTALYR